MPIGRLDSVRCAPLTDAGVTAYRAMQTVAPHLHPGSYCVIFGIGALRSFAVQCLHLLTGAVKIAVDRSPDRLALASQLGANIALEWHENIAEEIMEATGGQGAAGIIDIVGSDATLAAAARVSRPQRRIVLVGLAGGTLTVGWGHLASTCAIGISIGGTRADLADVIALAQTGKLQVGVERFAFCDVQLAYDRLRAGSLTGRAVMTFH